MSILDATNRYSSSQALSATAASTNVIDHTLDRDMGIGEVLTAIISVEVALDATDANETYSAVVQTDSVVGFGSATTLATFPTMTRGDAVGTQYKVDFAADKNMKQFTRINYTLGGTTPSGTVSAWLTDRKSLDQRNEYADGITPL